MSLRMVMDKFVEGYKAVRASFIVSIVGLLIELIFAILSGSMILTTDAVHWAVDGALEFTTMISLYLVIKVLKRFSWGVLYLESILSLFVSVVVLGTYIVPFIDYVNTVVLEPKASVTTTEPWLAIVSVAGMLLTLYSMRRLGRAYKKTGLEVLRAEYTHAMIDTVAASIVTIGILVTAITRSKSVELLTIIASLFFVFHSVVDVFEDAIRSLLGLNTDAELEYKLRTALAEKLGEGIRVKRVDVRKVGSFYVAKAELYVHPQTTITRLHKLRLRIIDTFREVNEMIYHVDVVFFPAREETSKRRAKARKGTKGSIDRDKEVNEMKHNSA